MHEFVNTDLIFMTLAGSNMYGMATPQSDIDLRGVCVPPKNVVMGFANNFRQQQVPGEDTTIFALMRFMELAADNNPNIIELLFAPEDCIRTIHPTWERLLERRDEFLSAKCYHTFSGYAHGQMKRIKGHRVWLNNPPKRKPTRAEFGLPEEGTGIRELAKGVDVHAVAPDALKIIEKEKRYKSALKNWTDYQTWKKKRNPQRAALEAKFGYDTKHASHLIRLLRMGYEILTTGKLIVRRPDAEELLAIRRGAKTYDELMEEAETLNNKLDEIYNDKSYVVPFSPPKAALSDFAVELHDHYWTHGDKR